MYIISLSEGVVVGSATRLVVQGAARRCRPLSCPCLPLHPQASEVVGLQYLAQAVQSLAEAVNTGVEAHNIVRTLAAYAPHTMRVPHTDAPTHTHHTRAHTCAHTTQTPNTHTPHRHPYMHTPHMQTHAHTPHTHTHHTHTHHTHTHTHTHTLELLHLLNTSSFTECCLPSLSCTGGLPRFARPFLLHPVPRPPPELSSGGRTLLLAQTGPLLATGQPSGCPDPAALGTAGGQATASLRQGLPSTGRVPGAQPKARGDEGMCESGLIWNRSL